MGHAGDTTRPEVRSAVERVGSALQSRRRAWGLPVTAATRGQWVGAGAQLLYVPLETIVRSGWAAYREAA